MIYFTMVKLAVLLSPQNKEAELSLIIIVNVINCP